MAKRAERGKAYYMISAVSQKYNIHPQTLRLYEREGLLKPSRTDGNTRLYSEEDLEQLETILTLTRDLGVNLAGVADGARVRVPGKGNAGGLGGPAGDVYITVRVAPHPVYRRDGNDLHMVVPIAVHEAALGARIEIATPDGAARLRVPPGTQSGQRLRLRERGAHSPRSGERGDLVVEVRLMLPRVLDERSKDLLREFGRINGENVRE